LTHSAGAIAGVLGAYLLLYPRARVLTLVPILFLPIFIDVSAFFFLGIWFAGQVISAGWTMIDPHRVAPIAFWAHIGGFVAGLLLVHLLVTSVRAPRRLQPDERRHDLWVRMR
jgi:membrane associated rhomboid family serine protease